MAIYAKQSDTIVLVYTRAEAAALLELAYVGADRMRDHTVNGATKDARERAIKALELGCTPSARSGAAVN